MSKKKDYEPQDIAYPEQKIVEIDLEHEMQTAYMDYAMSVIVGAAGALTHPAVHQENVYLRRHGGSEAGAGLF